MQANDSQGESIEKTMDANYKSKTMTYRRNPLSLDELRAIAQTRRLAQDACQPQALSAEQAQRLIEELELQKIEMELQNEFLETTRRQLEQALAQSNDLFDFARVGVFSLDPAGAISRLNLAGARLLGQNRAGLLGLRLGLFVADTDTALFDTLLKQTSSTENQSAQITLADQVTMVTLITTLQTFTRGWQVLMIDITEQQQLQDQLHLSQARLAQALDSSGICTWDWHLESSALLVSKSYCKLLGYAEGQMDETVQGWRSRIHPHDRAHVLGLLQAYLDKHSPTYQAEYRMQCKDGAWKWVMSQGAVIEFGRNGQAARMTGTCSDISERKAHEQALSLAHQFQQAVFDSLAAQVAVIDSRGRVLQSNAAWRAHAMAIGLADDAFKNGNYLQLLAALTEPNQPTVSLVAQGLATLTAGECGEFHLSEPFYSVADQRWFSLKITAVRDALNRLVVSHEDVTAVKQTELTTASVMPQPMPCYGALSKPIQTRLAKYQAAKAATP